MINMAITLQPPLKFQTPYLQQKSFPLTIKFILLCKMNLGAYFIQPRLIKHMIHWLYVSIALFVDDTLQWQLHFNSHSKLKSLLRGMTSSLNTTNSDNSNLTIHEMNEVFVCDEFRSALDMAETHFCAGIIQSFLWCTILRICPFFTCVGFLFTCHSQSSSNH